MYVGALLSAHGVRGPEGRHVLERQRGSSPHRAPRDPLHMRRVGIPTLHSTALNAEPSSTQASRTLWKFQLPQSSTPHVGPSTGVTLRPADGCTARSEPRVSPLCSPETQEGSSAPTSPGPRILISQAVLAPDPKHIRVQFLASPSPTTPPGSGFDILRME